jgi:hypothetical protein
MSDTVYIGRVKWVHENLEKNYRHAIVEPLIQSSEDQKSWIVSLENPYMEFPARGYVYWHDAPKGLTPGDIRQFEIERHPFYKGETDRDAYQVKNPKLITAIIDLREIGSESDIRILATAKGIFLKDGPLGDQGVLWIQDDKWVGPVALVRQTGSSGWVVSRGQDLASIKCWKMPSESIQQVELAGTRHLLAPNQDSLGRHIGFVNWEADEILAKRVLNRLLKRDPETAKALEISKKVFKKYIEKIEQAGLIGSSSAQELAFQDRIKSVLEAIEKNEELLNEAANVCFAIDHVKEKIEKKAEEEYKEKLVDNEKRLKEDLATETEQLQTALETLSKKQVELALAEEKLQALNKKFEERLSGFDSELENRLRDLAEKPERLFADMAVVKALVTKVSPGRTRPRPVGRRMVDGAESDIPIVDEQSVLMGGLSSRLLSSRISPVVGFALQASLQAGLVPILIGSEAYDVVSSYADCISGGTLYWIPVGGSLFEPSDLLARFDPISCRLVPHPGGLLDLLLDESDDVHVVVLDGFNRAAVDGYLIPLIRSAQDVARGRNPRSIPLAPPGFVSEHEAYADVSRIVWNPNVLLVLSPSTGVSTLPMPLEFWANCTIIDAGTPAPPEVPPESTYAPKKTRVPAPVWKTWSEAVKEGCRPLEALRTQPKETSPLPEFVLDNVERLYASGMVLGLKQRALEQAVVTSLYPYLVANGERVDLWFQHIGVALSDADRRIGDVVKRFTE